MGRWQRSYPGVVVTYPGTLQRKTEISAALLYAGRGAAASHETAAELWNLLDAAERRRRSTPATVHVTVPADRRVMAQPGFRVHYSRRLADEVHPARSISTLRLEPTVLDLVAASSRITDVVGWVTLACRGRKTVPARLVAALASRPQARWHRELTLLLGDSDVGVQSPLEWLYLHRVETAHCLPAAVRQVRRRVRRRTQWVDARYDRYRLIVELDGRLGHENEPFRDHERDNASTELGWNTLRYGWLETFDVPCSIAEQVARVLRRNGWPGEPRPCGAECGIRKSA